MLAVGATTVVCACGGDPQLGCSGQHARANGPACTPGDGLRLTGVGRPVHPVWRGYFDERGPRGWQRLEARPGGLRVVRRSDAPAPLGRFTVRPGDDVHKGERAELVASVANTGAREGAESWYAWSTFFPADLRPVGHSDFNVITQFHGTSPYPCSPTLQLVVSTHTSPPRLLMLGTGGPISPVVCHPPRHGVWDAGPVRLGRWNDFVLHVRWSENPRRGLVELGRDGRRVVAPARFPTLYPHEGAYLKQGFYRDTWHTTSRIYQTGVTRFVAADG